MIDWIITIAILVTFLLVVLARATGCTIKELLSQLRDFLQESKEDTIEEAPSVTYYQ